MADTQAQGLEHDWLRLNQKYDRPSREGGNDGRKETDQSNPIPLLWLFALVRQDRMYADEPVGNRNAAALVIAVQHQIWTFAKLQAPHHDCRIV